jgi:hypothetical protein
MYRPDNSFDVKLRLGEIDRRFNEIIVVSSQLAHMAEQLTRLRKMNARVLLHRSQPFKPSQNRRRSRNCDKIGRRSFRAGVEH